MKVLVLGRVLRRAVLLSSVLLPSCSMAPVGSSLEVPSDAALTCKHHCESIGLPLSAVAIMASNVGCVCEAAPLGSERLSSEVSSKNAVTGGMATIMLQEEQRRRAEEQRRQQQQRQQQQYY